MKIFKRDFSETSNDYISSDIKSTIYDIDHADIVSLNNPDNVRSISINSFSHFPLVTDKHSHPVPV